MEGLERSHRPRYAFIGLALVAACSAEASSNGGGNATAAPGGEGGTAGAGTGGAAAAAGSVPTGGHGGAGGSVDPCEPISGVSYGSISPQGPPTDRPAEAHPDLNLKIRGWEVTGGELGLVSIAGPTDPLAPKLNRLFSDDRIPAFATNYAVYQWDWGSESRGPLITEPEVTLAGFTTTAGEVLELPVSGYEIAPGYQALVLYADDDSITLKYTAEDNVVWGYTIHVVGTCVEPSLLARYAANNTAGRQELPALAAEQPFGRARASEIQVSIRDTGAFMDPRSDKDWWP